MVTTSGGKGEEKCRYLWLNQNNENLGKRYVYINIDSISANILSNSCYLIECWVLSNLGYHNYNLYKIF